MKDFFCLWLVPGKTAADELVSLVDALAEDLGGPLFSPHLTLIDETEDTREGIEAKVARIAAGFRPIEAQVGRVETGDSYYRSLYLRFDNAGELRTLKAAMGEATTPSDVDAFMPHISLFYGESAGKPAARDRLQPQWAGRSVRFERIAIVPSGRRIPIDQWKELASFDLGRAS